MAVSLTVLGSADAFNSGGRGHACYLLEDAHGAACIDFGPTAVASLKRFGRDPNDLDGVYLTHLHGDHFGGLQTLLVDAYYRGFRTRPLTIAGPTGTRARVTDLFTLAYRSIAKTPPRFPLVIVEYAPGDQSKILGRTVSVLQADHQNPPDEVACLLRIENGERILAFSGDTGWTDELVRVSAGADLFVCECSFHTTQVPQHLSWQELEPKLALLSAKRVLLTHLSDEMRAHAAQAAQSGKAEFADDGLRIAL